MTLSDLQAIRTKCSQFLVESGPVPLVRILPIGSPSVTRIKARKKKHPSEVGSLFDQAFERYHPSLTRGSIIAHPMGSEVIGSTQPLGELYYIIPEDGYRYIYNPSVSSSSTSYQQIISEVATSLGSYTDAVEVLADILRSTYRTSGLSEAIDKGAEVIIYDTPAYYAVRATAITYPSLRETIKNAQSI